jgi:single-strand DNA-binding protein
MSFQQMIVAGSVGQDPTGHDAENGKAAVASFSIATTGRKQPDGTYETVWFKIRAFRGTAEYVGANVQARDLVLVVGRFEMETFKRKDGSEGWGLTVLADNVRILKKAVAKVSVKTDGEEPF